MASKFAISRLVAREISSRNFGPRRDQLLTWIEGQPDEGIASDALLGALGYSKDVDRVLVEAERIYAEAVANDESPIDAGVGDLVDRVTDIEDAIPLLGSKFRGDWAVGDLAYTQNFAASVAETGWSHTGTVQKIAMGARDDRNLNPPNYPFIADFEGASSLTLDTSAIEELAGKALVRCNYWLSISRASGAALTHFDVDGVTQSTATNPGSPNSWGPFIHYEIDLSSDVDPVLKWEQHDSYHSYLTGIELIVSQQPYMLGEFVISGGKMWKSKANVNGATPGQDASWEEVPVNFNQTYTTAGRPSAVSAGKGASIYDSTLNIPLFSNGAAWTDATGTVA